MPAGWWTVHLVWRYQFWSGWNWSFVSLLEAWISESVLARERIYGLDQWRDREDDVCEVIAWVDSTIDAILHVLRWVFGWWTKRLARLANHDLQKIPFMVLLIITLAYRHYLSVPRQATRCCMGGASAAPRKLLKLASYAFPTYQGGVHITVRHDKRRKHSRFSFCTQTWNLIPTKRLSFWNTQSEHMPSAT